MGAPENVTGIPPNICIGCTKNDKWESTDSTLHDYGERLSEVEKAVAVEIKVTEEKFGQRIEVNGEVKKNLNTLWGDVEKIKLGQRDIIKSHENFVMWLKIATLLMGAVLTVGGGVILYFITRGG